jgi:hypothetical protein
MFVYFLSSICLFDKEMPIVCKAAAAISFDPKFAKKWLKIGQKFGRFQLKER